MKKVISFDLDGTIVDARYGNMVWLEGIPRLYAEKHRMSLEEAKIQVKNAYDSVGESHLLWYDIDYWIERFKLSVSVPQLLHDYSGYIRLLPDVAEVVAALAGKYTLVIASNAARIFVEKELSHSDLARHFDHIISATTDFKMTKKQEEFYRKLCSTLGVTPGEIVHVGDHQVFDFEIPRMVGIDAYHYNPEGEKNGRVIVNFKNLLEWL